MVFILIFISFVLIFFRFSGKIFRPAYPGTRARVSGDGTSRELAILTREMEDPCIGMYSFTSGKSSKSNGPTRENKAMTIKFQNNIC